MPLTGGVALTTEVAQDDVRLIEITDTIAVNGVPVTGRELRDRVGADADAILRLSYLDADARRDLFAAAAPEQQPRRRSVPRPNPSPRSSRRRRAPEAARRRTGDRAASGSGFLAT